MNIVEGAAVAASAAATLIASVRWLRVAQREHYLPRSVARFAARWWLLWSPANAALAIVAVATAVASAASTSAAFLSAAIVATAPAGLGLRGRTSALRWTARLRRLAAASALAYAAVLGFLLGRGGDPVPVFAVMSVLTPLVVDAGAGIAVPLERRLAKRYVERAAERLRQVEPTVIAITGSYGKTTTKGLVAHLASGAHNVLASPRSFNNSAGLARTVNELLAPGTDVFVAEMGTYGPGEITEMVTWVRPRVSMITAIGPVHLERFRTESKIVESKFEIFRGAKVCILNVDSEWLRPLADRMSAAGRRVVRCSAQDPAADVLVRHDDGQLVVVVGGDELARVDRVDLAATNVACAVAAALAVDTPPDAIARRLATMPVAENRLSVSTGGSGATVIDDTYNANPAGARAALAALERHATPGGKRVVVTPGMVELGMRQYPENLEFAKRASAVASHLVVVGRTNRRALVTGARQGAAEVVVVDTRDDAVAWVRANLHAGDVVLYENDLPDHFA